MIKKPGGALSTEVVCQGESLIFSILHERTQTEKFLENY